MSNVLLRFVLNGQAADLEDFNQRSQRVAVWIGQQRAVLVAPVDREVLSRIDTTFDRYLELIQQKEHEHQKQLRLVNERGGQGQTLLPASSPMSARKRSAQPWTENTVNCRTLRPPRPWWSGWNSSSYLLVRRSTVDG